MKPFELGKWVATRGGVQKRFGTGVKIAKKGTNMGKTKGKGPTLNIRGVGIKKESKG